MSEARKSKIFSPGRKTGWKKKSDQFCLTSEFFPLLGTRQAIEFKIFMNVKLQQFVFLFYLILFFSVQVFHVIYF